MRKAGQIALLATLFGAPAAAHPLYLTGEIGTLPVLLMVEQNGSKLSGYYYYLRNGKEIALEGKIDTADGSFAFDEHTIGNPKTGSFKGTVAQGQWRGTWQKPDGSQLLTFTLQENTDALTGLSTQVDCTAKLADKKFGYIAATTFRLTATKGEVKRFSMAVTSPFKDERLDCKLRREDMVQVKSDAGLLLEAKDNVEGALRRCAVRILATANHFYVSVDDCKAANETWFCGGHASWTDLIVDRKQGTCKRVE